MSTLNRDQLRILSVAESILDDIYVDLCLAENDLRKMTLNSTLSAIRRSVS